MNTAPTKSTAPRSLDGRGAESQKPIPKESNMQDVISTPPKPRMPLTGTMEHRALFELLARGKRGMTSPEFQAVTGSWRLSAPVHELRRKGWPVEKQWVETRARRFARYTLVLGVPA